MSKAWTLSAKKLFDVLLLTFKECFRNEQKAINNDVNSVDKIFLSLTMRFTKALERLHKLEINP